MKHAYMIIAHKNDVTFSTLLRMLDHPDNDIFIHFDAKVKDFGTEEMQKIRNSLSHAGIFFTRRTSVIWGGYSQIRSELILLEAAVGHGHYDYYHLISGQDLPIQSTEEINSFFEKNKGKQFIETFSLSEACMDRVKYFYFAQERMGRKELKDLGLFLKLIMKATYVIQNRLKLYRNRKISFMRGANWFSITHELAEYILENRKWIRKTFRWTRCCDEVFLQTLIHNTRFEDQISEQGYLRCIDWDRGMPYIWKREDQDYLQKSPMLFARKFDSNVDPDIVEKICEAYG